MPILNIAGYQFVSLTHLEELQSSLLAHCSRLELKGTILLSAEGINLNLAGHQTACESFKAFLTADHRFSAMTFRESYSETSPFRHLRVKLKKEIITMRCPTVQPEQSRAPSLSPEEFKQWLDEKRDVMILDTRNDYEVRFGTFTNAVHLQIDDFSEFPEAAKNIHPEKPVLMFCTGGIRCEKAALHLLDSGVKDVYQLEGGILNYFAKVGGDHYDGECFVFDQRISVDVNLNETGTLQCLTCQGPIKPTTDCLSCLSLST